MLTRRKTGLLRLGLLLATLAAASCRPPSADAPAAPSESGWHEFTGTWTAAGTRRTMSLGGARQARLLDMRGSLVLAGSSRPAAGYRADVFVISDTATGLVGRAAWTDENGDQVFSELRGSGDAGDARILGTIVGGTGRFTGVEGEYSFTWQYMLEAEDGTVQGRSVGLEGRVRKAAESGEGRP